ncbi:myb family transcription factor PHL5-like [Quercus robur]|uniref:myb family transcription factor PHL5-like n=1 Tax=Quercus robur TaxID=38942 RepID=UPI002163C2F3|nr:myb family transcription factor PHL5-like [Quercus robur]
MNTHKIDCREQVNQSNGVINDCSSEFGNQSSEFLEYKPPWHMGTCFQPLNMEGGSQAQYIGPAKPSTTIMSRFESPASAFYATERCMGFPQYEGEVGNPSMNSQFSRSHDSQLPAYQSVGEDYYLRNTLQAIVKSQFSSNQYSGSFDNSYKISCSNSPACKLLPHEQNKLLGDDTNYGRRHLLIPFKGNQEIQDHMANCNSYNSPLGRLNFSSQQEKHSPRESVSVTSGNSASTGAVLSSKTRIRWTQDLHEKFVECVNRLGGAEKATPKAILKLMETDGLTIFHVKSHLQKYRIAKYMPDSTEGKSEKRNILNNPPLFDAKTGLQFREALQLQLEVQRRLHEQLEIQRNLQLKIEEQGKQLKMMFDQQQKTNCSILKNHNLDTTFSADPSISLNDIRASIAESSGNSHFPSKIS